MALIEFGTFSLEDRNSVIAGILESILVSDKNRSRYSTMLLQEILYWLENDYEPGNLYFDQFMEDSILDAQLFSDIMYYAFDRFPKFTFIAPNNYPIDIQLQEDLSKREQKCSLDLAQVLPKVLFLSLPLDYFYYNIVGDTFVKKFGDGPTVIKSILSESNTSSKSIIGAETKLISIGTDISNKTLNNINRTIVMTKPLTFFYQPKQQRILDTVVFNNLRSYNVTTEFEFIIPEYIYDQIDLDEYGAIISRLLHRLQDTIINDHIRGNLDYFNLAKWLWRRGAIDLVGLFSVTVITEDGTRFKFDLRNL